MNSTSQIHFVVISIMFVVSAVFETSAQKTVYLSLNGKKSFTEINAVANFQVQPENSDTFSVYVSAKGKRNWEKPRHQFSVVKQSEEVYHIFSNKELKGNYRIREITDTTEIGFVIKEYDKQKNPVFEGEALQAFPLLHHGQTTLFDNDGQPMSRISYLMEKPMREEMLFSPVDSSQKITRQPEFPGGINAFQMEIARNITFPRGAQKNKTSGIVYIKFTIDTDGDMKNISPALETPKEIANEGVKVVKSVKKKWLPAERNGIKIPAWYYAKVSFLAY